MIFLDSVPVDDTLAHLLNDISSHKSRKDVTDSLNTPPLFERPVLIDSHQIGFGMQETEDEVSTAAGFVSCPNHGTNLSLRCVQPSAEERKEACTRGDRVVKTNC